MLTLTRKVDYAMIAVAHLCTEPGRISSAREISAHYGISERLVANILKDLVRSGVVSSTRGARGGYHVSRPPSAITVRQVYEALQGTFQFAPCTGDDGGRQERAETCDTWACCPAKHKVGFMHARIRDLLERITFADLAEQAAGHDPSACEPDELGALAPGPAARAPARGGGGPMQV